MSTDVFIDEDTFTAEDYERDALEYLAGLPLEHFMDSTGQSVQRAVTAASFRIISSRMTKTHYFDELLVQYFAEKKLRRVVPDGMVVVGDIEPKMRLSYSLKLEGVKPLMSMEYVSDSSEGKDYGESYDKYELELQLLYCVIYDPRNFDLQIYRHDGRQYVQMKPDSNDRYHVPELDVEIGVIEGWMRFWHRGKLVDLPEELDQQLQQQEQRIQEQQERLNQLNQAVQTKDQQLQTKDQQLQAKDQQLQTKDQQLQTKDQQLQAQDQLIQQKDELLRQTLTAVLQQQAAAAGRDDILQQLSPTVDLETLQQWLAELTG